MRSLPRIISCTHNTHARATIISVLTSAAAAVDYTFGVPALHYIRAAAPARYIPMRSLILCSSRHTAAAEAEIPRGNFLGGISARVYICTRRTNISLRARIAWERGGTDEGCSGERVCCGFPFLFLFFRGEINTRRGVTRTYSRERNFAANWVSLSVSRMEIMRRFVWVYIFFCFVGIGGSEFFSDFMLHWGSKFDYDNQVFSRGGTYIFFP